MGLAGIFFAISRSGLGFYFAVALVESALTLTVGFLAEKGVTLLLQRTACPVYTREETLSLLLLAGGALAGLASVEVSAVPLRRSRNVTFYCPQFGRDAGGMLP